jgi:glycosyltransferase involved in cell wall biosynthesis
MLNGKRIVVVMPAYNAEKTLIQTFNEIPRDIVDDVILTDDASTDSTISTAKELGITTFVHTANRGYGANQKTCYQEALRRGADIIVMLHPDYQYTPLLVTALASMIAYGVYDAVIASRILGNTARSGGMPAYKYLSNRVLTLVQNILIGQKLSEYHTGYRAYSKEVFSRISLEANSDDFVFDNELLVQIHFYGFRIGEVSCPTRYFPEASSIDFRSSVRYGLGVLWVSVMYRLVRMGLVRWRLLK